MSLKPSKEKRSQFDLDLEFGEFYEDQLAEIFGTKKVEVKADTRWKDTGNLAVEYECFDKPSGISVTKADYWAFALTYGRDKQEECAYMLIPTKFIKEIVKEKPTRLGVGDRNKANIHIMAISDLKHDLVKAYNDAKEAQSGTVQPNV